MGATGVAAATLARATVPAAAKLSGRPAATQTQSHPSSVSPPGGDGGSAATSVIKSLAGSSSSGGLGPLLPIILIVTLPGAAALGISRRQRKSS